MIHFATRRYDFSGGALVNARTQIVIAGVGEAPRDVPQDLGALDMCAEAVARALADAGLGKADADGLITGYTLSEPYPFFSSALAERIGVNPRFQQTLSLGGATGTALVQSAAAALKAGYCSTAVVVWGDSRSAGAASGRMVETFAEIATHPDYEAPYGASIPAMYALVSQRFMNERQVTEEDLAQVAVQARAHAMRHPNASRRDQISVDDVLSSPMVASPLHVLDCCLITDFAVAIVLTTKDRVGALDAQRCVEVLGTGQGFTHEFLTAAPDQPGAGAGPAVSTALAEAGLQLADLDFAELYDCFTITTLILLEEMGFCGPGDGAALMRSGVTALGGQMPVNTHGGLLSYGSGGITLVAEAVTQLRQEAGDRQVKGAEVGLVHNLGGILSLHVSLALGRVR
jgi:acetyl-CoA acetyltransferase